MENLAGPTILEQLNAAWSAKGWTVRELLERSGLLAPSGDKPLDRWSLADKMRGKLALKGHEIEALARCLDVTIVYPQPALSSVSSTDEDDKAAGDQGAA